MDVMVIRIVILFHGRDRQKRNALNVAGIWLKKATSLYVLMKHAAM